MFLRLFLVFTLSFVVLTLGNNTLSQKPGDFWDENEPFSQANPSANLRLPPNIVPSFYRLKLRADLDNSNFTGEVYITIKSSKKTKEIVLHSKDLKIIQNAKLTEQIYEKVGTLRRRKRDVAEIRDNNVTTVENTTTTSGDEAKLANQSNLEISTENVPLTINLLETNTNGSQSVNSSVNVTETTETSSGRSIESEQSNSSNVINEIVQDDSKSGQNSNTKIDIHTQVTHSSVRNIDILSIKEATGDRLVITLANNLKPNVDYILEIHFEGKISDSLTGFYKNVYTDADKKEKYLATTQFEPTSARAAFPCFDEPSFKAKFEISIAHRTNTTVLSTMRVAATEPVENESGWEWTHFERSVHMSTYLVAYVICEFKSLETNYLSKDNITKPIRIWTRPELIKKAEYALSITPKLLEFYEELFGVPYALDKLDLIALPDFGSGAMENWGLITFRETALLFDEANSAPRDKQSVAVTIAHELAHQWFGNLVTMRWWTDLWLNEGFATYVEYIGANKVEPQWNMLESFTRDMLDLLRGDSLKNTSPVSQQVVDASEISQKFDEISYNKGANLIRMLNHTMSEELFHKGLVNYLNQWKFANAEENDLWEAMSGAVTSHASFRGRSLVAMMNSWTRQAGYPVVRVTRDYQSGEVKFEQRLFSSSKEPYKAMLDQLWQIPITYVGLETPPANWSTRPQLWLDTRDATAHVGIGAEQALYVNVQATGYYRVNYDQRNWELLSASLRTHAPPTTRAQLIDDAFNLAKADQLQYNYALELTTSVIEGEDSRIVWDLLLNNMAFLKANLKATSGYVYFQDYMKILLRKQLETVNYGLRKPVDDNEAFLMENLVTWECMVEAPRCLDWAKGQFDSWMRKPDPADNPIPSYLRGLVYNMALKYGGRREFDFLWNVFQNSTDPIVKSLVISSLPSTRDEALITMLLEKSLTEIPKQYSGAAWAVEPPVGTRLAQTFLVDNFERVYGTINEIDPFLFAEVLNGAFGFIAREDELDKLKSFALSHKPQLMGMSHTLQKLVDSAKMRIAWVRAHAPTITSWLQQRLAGTNNATKTNETQSTQPNNSTIETVVPPTNNTVTTEPKSGTNVDFKVPTTTTVPSLGEAQTSSNTTASNNSINNETTTSRP